MKPKSFPTIKRPSRPGCQSGPARLSCCSFLPAQGSPSQPRIEEITFELGSSTSSGDLRLPEGTRPIPGRPVRSWQRARRTAQYSEFTCRSWSACCKPAMQYSPGTTAVPANRRARSTKQPGLLSSRAQIVLDAIEVMKNTPTSTPSELACGASAREVM